VSSPAPSARFALLAGAATFSGAAALGYEVLWVRRLGEVLGSTATAINVVLAVFFAGLGLGSWMIGRLVDEPAGVRGRSAAASAVRCIGRRSPAAPGRRAIVIFCALELTIAVWGLVFWPASDAFDALYVSLAPSEWALSGALLFKGAGAALLLAVPTFAMGGTLPALARHAVQRSAQLAPRLGWLYGCNTIGAAFGVVLVVFALVPRLGLVGSAVSLAGLNLLAVALAAAGRERSAPGLRASVAVEADPEPNRALRSGSRARAPLALAAWSGFASVALEVLWTRALAARFLSTVYSFATILFVFLLCLGLGSLLVGQLDRRGLVRREAAAVVMIGAGLSGALSVCCLSRLGAVSTAGAGAASGLAGLQLGELLRALLVMALPTLLFGLNFPLLCRLAHSRVQAVGAEIGSVYLANTLGSVAAPLLIGFWILPRLGLRTTLLGVAWAALAAGLALLWLWARPVGRRAVALSAAALALAALFGLGARGEVRLWRESATDRLVRYEEGVAAAMAVVEAPDESRVLKIDNSYHLGGTRNGFAQGRQGLVPLLLCEDPRSALFIGLGTGCSAGAAAAWGGLAIDVLEVVPGLERMLPLFEAVNFDLAGRLAADPRLRLLEVDGRHFVRTTARRYDVVVGDLFVPWRAGEGAMYTREHLEAVRGVLAPGGLFVQWLPIYQLRRPELETILATFCAVFPQVEAFWLYFNVEYPAIGVAASTRALGIDVPSLRRRLEATGRRELIGRLGLSDQRALLGSWIAGRDDLLEWSRGAPLETQRRPRVEFRSPYHRFKDARSPASENVPLMLALTRPVEEAGFLRGAAREEVLDVARHQRSIGHSLRALHELAYERRAPLAVEQLAAALQETPEWEWIAWNLEQVVRDRLSAGRLDTARRAAQVLQGSARFEPFGCYYAAVVEAQAGDVALARRLAERALELDPQHEGARRLLEGIGH